MNDERGVKSVMSVPENFEGRSLSAPQSPHQLARIWRRHAADGESYATRDRAIDIFGRRSAVGPDIA
jgi:hypothetical protein